MSITSQDLGLYPDTSSAALLGGSLDLMILISAWIMLAAIPMGIAKSKGRSPFLWYIYGLLLLPVAVVHAVAMDERDLDPVYKAVRDQTEVLKKLLAETTKANSLKRDARSERAES